MSLIVDCFRRLTDSPCKNELRGYKVTDVSRSRKFGIACRSLHDLKRKACTKLNIPNDPAEVNVFLVDGSLIDEEYFHTLEPQSMLILQKPGEKMLSDADILYDALRRVNIDFLVAGDRVAQFLTENLKAKVAVLNSVLNKDDSKTAFSTRDEHPEWFTGLETNYTTKEAYMHRRCQDRIRGYLYKTIEQIKCSDVYMNNHKARQQLLHAIAFFKVQLKEDHYFGYYFDRSRAKTESDGDGSDETDASLCYEHCPCKLAGIDNERYLQSPVDSAKIEDETDARQLNQSAKKGTKDEQPESCPYCVKSRGRNEQTAICDNKGEFRCEGRWNMDDCAYGDRHKINPYRSKEEFVLFSTWNLDHKIERSRTLVPKLLQISLQDIINEQDIYDCYDNLFTVKNLKLVHIVCHDKGLHK
ncbi:DNA fragmentation factor subunit beta isoform X2 [Harpegnathos saltator]|uniref:DNA fragmentation factor subunit beta isoform X2 n=1 Tax=Harpegnathos saltator TaxID=610380 RepID=UPI000590C97A|nr:DNA fragmentation factor subunit beta isoform X2 [Harpegnathos saltator]